MTNENTVQSFINAVTKIAKKSETSIKIKLKNHK